MPGRDIHGLVHDLTGRAEAIREGSGDPGRWLCGHPNNSPRGAGVGAGAGGAVESKAGTIALGYGSQPSSTLQS